VLTLPLVNGDVIMFLRLRLFSSHQMLQRQLTTFCARTILIFTEELGLPNARPPALWVHHGCNTLVVKLALPPPSCHPETCLILDRTGTLPVSLHPQIMALG
jgi:hypothetical protein